MNLGLTQSLTRESRPLTSLPAKNKETPDTRASPPQHLNLALGLPRFLPGAQGRFAKAA